MPTKQTWTGNWEKTGGQAKICCGIAYPGLLLNRHWWLC